MSVGTRDDGGGASAAPEAGVNGHCELPEADGSRCGSSKEQQVPLTAEQSLQPPVQTFLKSAKLG